MRALFIVFTLGALGYGAWLVLDGATDADRPRMVDGMPVAADGAGDGDVQRIYRWRDGNGNLVISDEPPPEGVSAEVIELTPPPAPDPARGPIDAPAGVQSTLPYGEEGLRRLRERAGATAEQLEARRKLMDSLQEQL